MAQLIINFETDEDYNDSIQGISERYGYRDKIRNEAGEVIDNPLTREQFAKQSVAGEIKRSLEAYRTRQEQAAVADKVKAAMKDVKIG